MIEYMVTLLTLYVTFFFFRCLYNFLFFVSLCSELSQWCMFVRILAVFKSGNVSFIWGQYFLQYFVKDFIPSIFIFSLCIFFFFYLIPYGMPFSFSYLFSYFFHFFLFSFLEDFLNFIFQLFCWVFHFQHNLKEISKSSFFVIWMSILFFSIYSFSWTQKYFLSGNINDAFIYSFIFKVFFSLYNVGLFQDNMCVALSLDWLVMIKSWGFQSWLEDLSAWVRFCTLL